MNDQELPQNGGLQPQEGAMPPVVLPTEGEAAAAPSVPTIEGGAAALQADAETPAAVDEAVPGDTPMPGVEVSPVVDEDATPAAPSDETSSEAPVYPQTVSEWSADSGMPHAEIPAPPDGTFGQSPASEESADATSTSQPVQGGEIPDTVIQDSALAEDMARAGNFQRTRAAEIRRNIKAENDFKDALYTILNDPNYIDTRLGNRVRRYVNSVVNQNSQGQRGSEWAWGTRLPRHISEDSLAAIQELKKTAGSENQDIIYGYSGKYDPIHVSSEVFRGMYDPEDPLTKHQRAMLERASGNDENAERRENWAKLLHDKPVSEAYQQAHPDFEFDPQSMIELQQEVDARDGLDWGESFLGEDHLDAMENLSFSSVLDSLDEAVQALKELSDDPNDLVTELSQMMQTGSTTLADLSDMNKRIRREYNNRLRAKADDRKQVFADVISGRASEGGETPAEDQDDVEA